MLHPVKQPKDTENLRFVTTYSGQAQDIYKILRKHWHVLLTDRNLYTFLKSQPQVTFQRNLSLRDQLSPSLITQDLGANTNIRPGFKCCRNCKACSHSVDCNTFTIASHKRECVIKRAVTCNTMYCVYALICPCNKAYISSTIHRAKKRVLEHMRAISHNNKVYPVARHFYEHHFQNESLLRMVVINVIPDNVRGGNRQLALLQLESRYIIDLETMAPMGLNSCEELAVHLQS